MIWNSTFSQSIGYRSTVEGFAWSVGPEATLAFRIIANNSELLRAGSQGPVVQTAGLKRSGHLPRLSPRD